MNGAERMQSAQSQLLAAQAAIAAEQFEALQEQQRVAKEEGRKIDERIKETGSSLAAKHREAEPLWERRALISKTRDLLDDDFHQNDFASDQQTEEYEQKRAALTSEWHDLTEKITSLSYVIAPLEEEFRKLKFARGQVAGRVSDLRQAIAETRRAQRL